MLKQVLFLAKQKNKKALSHTLHERAQPNIPLLKLPNLSTSAQVRKRLHSLSHIQEKIVIKAIRSMVRFLWLIPVQVKFSAVVTLYQWIGILQLKKNYILPGLHDLLL